VIHVFSSGRNYTVNVPLKDGMDDEHYTALFEPIMAKVLFSLDTRCVASFVTVCCKFYSVVLVGFITVAKAVLARQLFIASSNEVINSLEVFKPFQLLWSLTNRIYIYGLWSMVGLDLGTKSAHYILRESSLHVTNTTYSGLQEHRIIVYTATGQKAKPKVHLHKLKTAV
jgi:hypothetical protein